MSQFLLAIHHGDLSDEAGDAGDRYADVAAFNAELHRLGHWVFAGGLTPARTAVVVDATSASPGFSDGPYLKNPEYLGGFWVIEADDLSTALAVAERASRACRSAVEVRAFQGE